MILKKKIEKEKIERGNFLNDDQKKLKQKIMQELMEALFVNINNNIDTLTAQSGLDLFFSIIIMFNRDSLISILDTFDLFGYRENIMNDIFELTRKEVERVIKTRIQ